MHALRCSVLLIAIFSYKCYAGDDAIGNANHYVDEVLENLRNEPSMLSKIEPLEIPDVNEKNFQISKGNVTNLSSLYRHGDCSLDYENEIISVTAELAVRDIAINVKYRAKALFFWINGHVRLTVEDLAVKMVIVMQNGKARVDKFQVVHLGKYKIKKITGMSVVLNWLLKLIANAVAKNSRKKIIDGLENGVRDAVNDILKNFELPNVG